MKVLRLWVLPNEGFGTSAGLAPPLRDFHKEHPGLRVEVRVRTQSQIWGDLLRGAKRPLEVQRPDLVQIPHTWTSSLASFGLIEDLGELEPGVSAEPFLPALRPHCYLEGTQKVYSLPWWFELGALSVRPAQLRRAGFSPEDLGTWEGFRQACARIAHSRGVCPLGNSNSRHVFSAEDLAPRVWARGGDFLARDGQRSVLQREEGLKGAADYLELWKEGWMALPGPMGLSPGSVFDGTCAMQFSGRLPSPGGEITALPYPGEGPVLVSAQHLAVAAGTAQPKEALLLLRHLLEPRRQKAYAKSLRALPARAEAFEQELKEIGPWAEQVSASLARGRALPNNPFWGTYERIFSRAADAVYRHVLRRTYTPEVLRQEMVHAAAELDYVFQLAQL